MASFFDRMLGRGSANKGTSSTAKDRLQFVLVHDRINLPPERLKEMKEEILAVISKYVAVDKDRVDIALEQRDRNSKIVAEFPFIQDRRLSLPIDEDDDSPMTKEPPKTAAVAPATDPAESTITAAKDKTETTPPIKDDSSEDKDKSADTTPKTDT